MDIKERIEIVEKYLKAKIEERDWHGVSDAANDLREMEIEHKYLSANIIVNGRRISIEELKKNVIYQR